jgi:hypothetical protein
VGFQFSQSNAQRFGARIFLNDIAAATPLQVGGGLGVCRFGTSRTCTTVSDCDVDTCKPDGRCSARDTVRCETDADCTLANECVMFSYPAELSVGQCALDASIACSGDHDCTVGECAGEPTRSCRYDDECRRADGRTPTSGMCTSTTSRGACTEKRGNYWGRTCADSEGFRDSGELYGCTHDAGATCASDDDCSALSPGSTCILSTDSRSPLVSDGHPYRDAGHQGDSRRV